MEIERSDESLDFSFTTSENVGSSSEGHDITTVEADRRLSHDNDDETGKKFYDIFVPCITKLTYFCNSKFPGNCRNVLVL